MKLQYIEVFRHGERVYRGVAFGDKDAEEQVAQVSRGAALNNQELVYHTNSSWDIIDSDSRELWGTLELREF